VFISNINHHACCNRVINVDRQFRGIASSRSQCVATSKSCHSTSSKLRDSVLAELWLEIDELTSIQGSTYGIVKRVIEKNIKNFPWLSRDLLNNYRKKATKNSKLPS
jgi:hypothetical protein